MKSPAFDLQPVLEAVSGDRNLLNEIIATFIESTQSDVKLLQSALAKNDSKAVKTTAHHLKGSLLEFGAQELVALAFQLEQMGLKQQLAGAAPLCQELSAGVQNLVAVLDQSEYRRPA